MTNVEHTIMITEFLYKTGFLLYENQNTTFFLNGALESQNTL